MKSIFQCSLLWEGLSRFVVFHRVALIQNLLQPLQYRFAPYSCSFSRGVNAIRHQIFFNQTIFIWKKVGRVKIFNVFQPLGITVKFVIDPCNCRIISSSFPFPRCWVGFGQYTIYHNACTWPTELNVLCNMNNTDQNSFRRTVIGKVIGSDKNPENWRIKNLW